MFIHYEVCPLCEGKELTELLKAKDHTVSQEAFPIVVCGDCGFTFTQDVPDEEHIGPYYQSEDYISHSNTKQGLVNRAYHWARDYMLGSKKRLVEQHFPIEAGKERRLLDIGSGTGYFLNVMNQGGWQAMGVEPDSGARNFARKTFDLEVKSLDALFEFPENRFDVITMWHVLEHVHRLDETFEQIGKCLDKNGTLVIAVPNCDSLDAKHYQEFWAGWDVPRHLYHFTPKTMQLLAKNHHFAIKHEKLMPFDPFYISLLSEQYKNGRKRLLAGALNGGKAFIKAKSEVKRSSSVIYVMVKEA